MANYLLRVWQKEDWKPKSFTLGSYVLVYNETQVGVMAGPIWDIHRIDIEPKGQGHGTEFIKQVVEKAREAKRKGYINEEWLRVQSVQGDSPKDRAALEHILRDKFGFEREDDTTWRLAL